MPETPLHVCLVAPLPPPYGGIARWTQIISSYAKEQEDFDLRVVDTAVRWRAVVDIRTWKRVLGGTVQLLRDWFRVLQHLMVHTDVLHLATSGEFGVIRDMLMILTAKLFGVPVVYHIRYGRFPSLARMQGLEWRLTSWAIRMVSRVIAIDGATAATIREFVPGERVIQIPNCIDPKSLPEPSFSDSGDQTLVFLGWIIPTKGVEELLKAWSELRPTGWCLRLVGPFKSEYQEMLKEKYRAENVSFSGVKPHERALEMLAEADIFVLPSYSEGFPNSVIEAMALGKPIVATRVGAIPEMLEGECGFLIDPRNSSDLMHALARVMADSDLRFSMGRRARQRAMETYSVEKVFLEYAKVWYESSSTNNRHGKAQRGEGARLNL